MSLLGRARKIRRETLRKQWKAIAFIAIEFVAILLVVFELMAVVGLRVSFSQGQVSFAPAGDPIDYVLLALGVLLLAALYFTAKRSMPNLFKAHNQATAEIKKAAQEKLKKAKREPQAAALLLIEFLFVVVIVVAIQAYLDPQEELIPWSTIGVGPPVTTIVNAVIGIVVFAFFYWLYSLTSAYRSRR
ncbi:MAG: hypothetical protein NTW59_01170 [Candidatus Diapherotrites archaeon]|nr:hypothetical protein [Candidatus Diapherotrites archaeon]